MFNFALLIPAISALLGALGGGGVVAAFLKYRVQFRAADKVDFEALNTEVRRQRDEALRRVSEYEQRFELLEAEINGLRIARDLDPFPHWIMDIEGRYSFVNRPFEECFLEPSGKTYRDLIGKRHEDIWPEDFCRTIKALDAAARKRPDGTARAVAHLDVPTLGVCEVTVHKFPCRIKGVVVATAGYFTAIEPVEERVGWQETRT